MSTSAYRCLTVLLLLCSLVLANTTDIEDMQALMALKNGLLEGQDFSMDPCHWKVIQCSSDNRVISLNLSGYAIPGIITADIGSLTSLEHLNLSNNYLSGTIPPEIGNLFALQTLDLHSNNLSGSIPTTLENITNLNLLDLSNNHLTGTFVLGTKLAKSSNTSFEGNPGLCIETASNPCSESGHRRHGLKPGVVVGIVISTVAIVLFLLGAVIICWKRPHVFSLLHPEKNDMDGGANRVIRYTLQQIKAATEQFADSQMLGQSTFGVVYKGSIDNGPILAIKRLNNAGKIARRTFQEEVETISRPRHKNVAKLVGFCSTFREKILVFEYLPRGSLDSVLHGRWHGESLDWEKRKTVLLGVAKGLAYLHHMNPQIVHGAVKASNVLIEDDLTPKLTDYNISRPMQRRAAPSFSDVEWAIGYLAPELLERENRSPQSDCYSFGFLLVEVVTGKRPWQLLTFVKDGHYTHLRALVEASYSKEGLQRLVDVQLRHPPLWEVKKILELAVMCMDERPVFRPPMADVVQFLVEELLITNRSTDFDSLFIDLVMDPLNDGFQLQTPTRKGSVRRTADSLLPSSPSNAVNR